MIQLLGVCIFISYSHQDAFTVAFIHKLLECAYIQVLRDTGYVVPGMNVKERLEALIQSCQVMVFVVSSPSVASDWCRWERSMAARYHIPILPIKLHPSVTIPPELADLDWLDLSRYDLVEAVARMIGSVYLLKDRAA